MSVTQFFIQFTIEKEEREAEEREREEADPNKKV